MREIVFDTETTGLNPAGGDRMVEIGCVEMLNRVETGRHFHAYFNPLRAMPTEAEAIHGLSNLFLSAQPLFEDRVEELIEFLGDAPLVAHNASFDFGFLNHELQRCGRPTVCMSRMVDTLAIARTRHPGAKHSLDALCTRFGVDRSMRIKHGALMINAVSNSRVPRWFTEGLSEYETVLARPEWRRENDADVHAAMADGVLKRAEAPGPSA